MSKLCSRTINPVFTVWHQVAAEVRLFWRSRQAVYLNFFVPMLGMALFVYLNREGMLERVFGLLSRGLGAGSEVFDETSPMALMTVGMVTYCVITAAFEGMVPRVVRQRDAGILKRLGGTPLRRWIFVAGKALSASVLVFIEVALILAVGLVSSDIMVEGSWWLLGAMLLLGTFTLAALGFIVSNLTTSPDGAVVAVHAIYIPMLLLCGAFVPVEALPGILRIVAKVFPLTYFASPFRSVMVESAGLAAIGGDLLILVAWTVGSWIAAVKTFRWE
jgi:ABC-type multidrug transport system permease subunit